MSAAVRRSVGRIEPDADRWSAYYENGNAYQRGGPFGKLSDAKSWLEEIATENDCGLFEWFEASTGDGRLVLCSLTAIPGAA